MPLALKRYLICLGIVCAIMAMYCSTVVPMLEPPPREVRPSMHAEESGQISSWWSDLFPENSWQNGKPMVLQTEQGTLLFQKLEQIESSDKSQAGSLLLLQPLTLIVPLAREAKSLAVGDLQAATRAYRNSPLAVVVANEGAEILFKETPDFTNPKAKPQVIGGKLKGLIEIAGIDPRKITASGTPATDWLIRTSHVRIEGRRVWTNNEVEILSANSQASGQGLSILLKQDLLSPGADADGPWGLLNEMELNSLRQVDVRLPPGGLWKGLHLGSEAIAQAHEMVPARLQLFCKRNFTFYFDQCRGVLTDHVRMEHRFDGEDAFDEFKCHELKVEFSMPTAAAPAPPDAIMVGPMQLKVIDALGIDSIGPLPSQSTVAIDAPNVSAKLDAKRLQVLIDERRFMVHSRNGRGSENNRASPGSVLLSYLGNEFHAPNLEYQAARNDENLGSLLADGPGYVETSPEGEVGRVTARWNQQLTMTPKDNDQHIRLLGRALIESSSHGHLSSDQIDIRLSPSPLANLSPASPGSPTFLGSGDRSYQVQSITGTGEVNLGKHPQEVQVKQLHLKFVYPEKETAAAAASAALAGATPGLSAATLDLSSASGAPLNQFVTPPAKGLGATASSSALGTNSSNQSSAARPPKLTPPLSLPLNIPSDAPQLNTQPKLFGSSPSGSGSATDSMPVLVIGNELYSQIIVTSQQSWIDKLQITGHVVVSRGGTPPADALPWRVDGGELLLNSDVDNKFIMQVAGTPARISFGDGWIAGPVISLNQRTGLAWIDQPGALSLPTKLMKSASASPMSPGNSPVANSNPASSNPLASSDIEWLEPIKVTWQDRMLFNGNSAHLAGNIAISGNAKTSDERILSVKGSCDGLEVRMSRPVDIGQPGTTSATVQSVTLQSNVIIQTSQLSLAGQPLSLERVSVPELTYEPSTNRIVGKGAGTIHSQHYTSGGGIGSFASGGNSTPANNPNANSSAVLRANRPATIQALNLRFRDQMEAQLNNKLVTFLGKVEVGLSPVASLDQMLHLNDMRSLKLNQSLISGDLMRISDTSDVARTTPGSPISGAWEFESQGNVVFESKNESGELFGKAYRVTYFQAKDLLLIKGDTRIPAEVRLKPESNSSVALAIMRLWSGSINTKTMEPGPTGSGGEGEVQLARGTEFVPRGSPLVGDTWKSITPTPNASPGAPTAPTTPRPRDAPRDFFRQ